VFLACDSIYCSDRPGNPVYYVVGSRFRRTTEQGARLEQHLSQGFLQELAWIRRIYTTTVECSFISVY